ncbi:hypothetical protein [Pseudoalteromonas sp. 1_2015MBL_MicDiv]|uniref:hypothetical protein n=1 Tax=Pseudoalteromonas sp. 1_2015MBL_MicDiv TaxID=1720343 RepID=UPI000BBF0B07|nr:hypothetical protein [Pseudoalteromonas sp. 1_2015MBL_MicDiv]ATG77627.1 hypothetical protein AOR04_08815 [Pseudoalteromonas sp. 1_2015MBL_MicDiv]
MLELVPDWKVLKKFADIKLVKFSYVWIIIVPVLAKLLVQIGDVLPIKIGEVTFNINLSLPFSWQMFFFSALSFSLAQFIFNLVCPEIVKDFENQREFENDGKTVIQLGSYLKRLLLCRKNNDYKKSGVFVEFVKKKDLINKPNDIATQYIAHLNDEQQYKVGFTRANDFEKTTNLLIDLSPDRKKAIFEYVYTVFKVQNPITRIIVASLYTLGFILSAVVLLQNVISVIHTIF